MSTRGIFNTSNRAPTDKPDSFASLVHQKMPGGDATLLGLTSRLKETTIHDTSYTWYWEGYNQPKCVLAGTLPAAPAGSQMAVNIEPNAPILVNQILIAATTMEQMLVIGTEGDRISVRRGVGTTSPQALAVGEELYVVATAFEESSLRPLPIVEYLQEMSNRTQIVRNTWAVSGTQKEIAAKVGMAPDARSKRQAIARHARNIEHYLLVGELYSGVLNGQPLRKMRGMIPTIREYAPQNYAIAPAVMTYEDLEEMTDPWFDTIVDGTQANDRLLFGGAVAAKLINKMGREYHNTVILQPDTTSFGHSFTRFKTSRGSFIFMEHPLFNQVPYLRDSMLGLDLDTIEMLYLSGRKTDYKEFNSNINSTSGTAQDNGIDAIGGSYLTEFSLKVTVPESNGFITGLRDVGCKPCQIVTDVQYACLGVSHPCAEGAVQPNTEVTVFIRNGLPNTQVQVVLPEGTIQAVPLDAAGEGSFTYTVGDLPSYVFTISAENPQAGIIWQPAVTRVCVEQPCGGEELENDDPCLTP